MFKIPGFPKEVSEKIEMPDIAELLSYPMFHIAEAETVRKYGTEFQKKLLDIAPLRNNTKHVTILSMVHVVYPNIRTMTFFGEGNVDGREWHIDGEDFGSGNDFDHLEPIETCHLLLGHTQFVTEFADKDIFIIQPEIANMTREEFNTYLNNKLYSDLKGIPIENGKLYTFSNHIHRAVEPKRMEFRYSFRIRETNRPDILPVEKQIVNTNTHLNILNGLNEKNIYMENDNSIKIYFPRR